jgi:hypothetical protein
MAQEDRQRLRTERAESVIGHLPETRVPFGVPYSSDPNSEKISDLRKRGGCAEVSLEKP